MPVFMFTDIEGSTRKWQEHPEAMREALLQHDSIVRRAVSASGGRVVKHTGDGFMIVFENGRSLECALAIQVAVQAADWSDVDGLGVRIGLHSGDAAESSGDYFGDAVNRAARITASAWGGQTVASSTAAATEALPDGSVLEDAGMHMLKDLLQPEQLLLLSHPSLRSGFPPLATVSSSPHNLPVQPTPFVGRKSELEAIASLLVEPGRRLVTILGPGGAGKTRISLQAAAELIGGFRHGAWYVPLEDADSLSGMVSVIADSLSLRFTGGAPEEDQLRRFLSARELLLVLDNFEHLADHAALVSRLLAAAPGARVLVTSRQRLGIREESVFDLSGMAVPESGDGDLESYDSTSLFLASARRALPSYAPSQHDIRAIAGICRMVEGHPLAIELAASWVRTVPAVDLEREISSSLSILESSGAGYPERQTSIQAVFEYSWGLLPEADRLALAGLSVFEGGFDGTAALEVAGCDLRAIQRLSDRSLVRGRPGGGHMLHPLTRQFAAERQEILDGGREGIEERHSDYFRRWLDSLRPDTRGSRQAEAFDRISLELPNLRRGALHAARGGMVESLRSYLAALSIMLQLRSRFSEALDLATELREALDLTCSGSEGRDSDALLMEAELDERIGTMLLMTGRHREAGRYLGRAIEAACETGDVKLMALCYGGLGNAAHMTGSYDAAEENWSRALELARSGGYSASVPSLLCNLASARKRKGLYDEAIRLLDEAGELNRNAGDPYVAAAISSQAADLLELSGDHAGAEARHRESLEIRRSIGDLRGMSYSLERLSAFALERSPEEALQLIEEGLRNAGLSGSLTRKAYCRLHLARALAACGRDEDALSQLAEADREVEALGLPALSDECGKVHEALRSSGAGRSRRT